MLGSILVFRTPIQSSRNSTDEEERKERFLHTKVEDGVVVMIVFQLNGSLINAFTDDRGHQKIIVSVKGDLNITGSLGLGIESIIDTNHEH